MKIIDLIKSALKAKGVDEKYADRVRKAFKVEKEDDVAGAVDLFKDNVLPAITEAEEAAKKAALEELEKKAKEEKEKAEKEAKEKAEKEAAEKEAAEKAKKAEEDKGGDKSKELDPAIKALIDNQNKQLTEMKELLAGSQKRAEEAEKKATINALVKNAELPESWAERVKMDSDVKFEDQVKSLKEEYAGIAQEAINKKVAAGEYSLGTPSPVERSEAEWLKIMNGETSGAVAGVAPLE